MIERVLDQAADELGDAFATLLAQAVQAVVHLFIEAHGNRSFAAFTHQGLPVGWWSRTGRLAQISDVGCC